MRLNSLRAVVSGALVAFGIAMTVRFGLTKGYPDGSSPLTTERSFR